MDAGDVLEKAGVVIELQPLKTREERRRYYDSHRWSTPAPADRARRLIEALRAERAYLGLSN